jgi:hypothetical protein
MTKKRKPIEVKGTSSPISGSVGWGNDVSVSTPKISVEFDDDTINALGRRFMETCLDEHRELEKLREERKQVQQVLWTNFDEDFKDKIIKLRKIIPS